MATQSLPTKISWAKKAFERFIGFDGAIYQKLFFAPPPHSSISRSGCFLKINYSRFIFCLYANHQNDRHFQTLHYGQRNY
jgi:hypothetical protein